MSKLIAVWGTPQSGKTTFTVKLANALNLGGKGKSIHSAIAVFPDITTPVLPTVFPNKKDEELYSLGSVLQKPDLISQGKRVFQQVNDSFRRDTVLADTIPMLRISHNARIKTKSLVGIGVNTFSIGGIGTRCTASTNARTRFRNRNAFGTYLFETKGVILTVAFSEELKFLSALRTARLGYIFKERNQFALFTLH